MRLEAAVDAAWATDLGCDAARLREPGAHLVEGGAGLAGYGGVYMARVGPATLVYCPPPFRPRAERILGATDPRSAFGVELCADIANVPPSAVLGPSVHSFLDRSRFRPRADATGRRLDAGDSALAELRAAVGDGDWAEGGFFREPAAFDGLVYAIEDEEGRLVAAGNLTPYRGAPADVGLVTHPAHRGRGLARRLATRMVADALTWAEIVRYRALASNDASRRVARAVGFVERGANLAVRSPRPE